MHGSLLPDWAHQYLLEDERFAAAYARVGLQDKTRLKKCIAALHAWYGQSRQFEQTTGSDFFQGLQTWTMRKPRDWALVRVEPHLDSPAVLLATLLPPVLAGVREVVICSPRDRLPYPDAQLTAFELGGMDNVLNCPEHIEQELLREMYARSKSGMIISVYAEPPAGGSGSAHLDFAGLVPAYTLCAPQTAGLWIDDPGEWNFEALDFAQPSLRTTLWSAGGISPPPSRPLRRGTMKEFRQAGYDLLFVAPRHLRTTLGWAPVILGPGQESAWVWPEFCRSMCQTTRLVWHDPNPEDEPFPEPA